MGLLLMGVQRMALAEKRVHAATMPLLPQVSELTSIRKRRKMKKTPISKKG